MLLHILDIDIVIELDDINFLDLLVFRIEWYLDIDP